MGGLGRPLGAPLRGPLPLHLNSNALSGGHRATLRTLPSRADRRHSVEVVAFGGDPYEPLEKAINIINKVLTVGESKKGANTNNNGNGGGRDRWVQFGTEATARLSLQDLTAKDAELDRESTSRLLQEYLSLPVEEYSLLDPKWVVRETLEDQEQEESSSSRKNTSKNNSFRVSIPLKDMLGVDICPQVSIEARPDPLSGQVTLIGTRAVLGSPGLDEMFKLKLVAVMRCRRNDRHLPGRPVQRLRQWAARRRVKKKERMLVEAGGGSGGGGVFVESRAASSSLAVAEVIEAEFTDLNFSEEDEEVVEVEQQQEEEGDFQSNNEDGDDGSGSATTSFRFSTDLSSEESSTSSSFSATDIEQSNSTNTLTTTTTTTTTTITQTVGVGAGQAPLLDCKVQINMAVKVPGALRVVPNSLLGYAGSVITKTVLNAVLPNFLQLLSTDYKQWVAGGRSRRKEENSDSGSGSGEEGSLFKPLVSSSTLSSSE